MKITPYARVGRSPLISRRSAKTLKEIYYTKTLELDHMHPAVFRVQITKMWNCHLEFTGLCLRRFRQRRNNASMPICAV